jgi:hypothetical protein
MMSLGFLGGATNMSSGNEKPFSIIAMYFKKQNKFFFSILGA